MTVKVGKIHISGFELEFTELQWKTIIGIYLGLNNIEIGNKLGITIDMVRHNIRIIMEDTGLSKRLEVAQWYQLRRHRKVSYALPQNTHIRV